MSDTAGQENYITDPIPEVTVQPADEALRESEEQKQAALTTLRDCEQHLRLALESARMGSWQWDLVSGVLNASVMCKATLGLPADATFSYDTLMSRIYPDDRPQMQEAVRRTLETGTDYQVEYRILWTDGSTHWISESGRPLPNDAGHPVKMIGVTQDITERKRGEEERAYVMSGARCLLWYADIYETSNPLYLDWELHIPDVDAAQRFLPLDVREGQSYQEAWYLSRPKEDQDRCDQAAAIAVRAGRTYQQEFRCRVANSTLRWLHEDVHIETVEAGVRWRAIGVCTDITERKQLEMRLREETETLETINALGQRLAAELDLEKLVQAATDAARQLTGAQFGAFFRKVINPADGGYRLYTLSGVPCEAFAQFPMPSNTALFAPTFAGEGTVRLDDVTQDPRYGKHAPYDGNPQGHLPVASYLAVPVVSRAGEVLGGLFFGHERSGVFTERHERIVEGLAAQAAIAIDNARLFQAERERSEQLSVAISEVHHRVKNSLQSVGALLEMQIPVEGDSVPIEAVQDSLSQIKTIALVHDLLTRDRPIGSVDVAQVLTNLGRLLSAGMSAGQQQIRIVVDAEPVEMSTKNATSLALAVNELLTNAAKHQDVTSEAEIPTYREADIIAVTLRRSGDNITVAVQDTGPGFPLDFNSVLHANIGLQLVQTLIKHDLHGTVRFGNATASQGPASVIGGHVEIVFPASACAE